QEVPALEVVDDQRPRRDHVNVEAPRRHQRDGRRGCGDADRPGAPARAAHQERLQVTAADERPSQAREISPLRRPRTPSATNSETPAASKTPPAMDRPRMAWLARARVAARWLFATMRW